MLRSLINQRLGRYDIKELLGRGGMAAVYRATDTVLLRDVALKILYPHYSDDAGLVQRFQREAVTAAALEHPHIVSVYDVGEHDGMAYIAMKLLSGETFQDRLQGVGRVSLDELLAVLAPVASALDYAHARGVVHRDIKPGNIFLSATPDGQRVLITDFGIAKQLDTPGLTTTGALIGTPDYMAPEQIGARPVDGRTDVYALGMLAYRALTGRRAFEGSTQDVLLGHLYERPLPPSQLNPALPAGADAVIEQATAREPADRFATAGAFVQALRHVAAGAAASTAAGTAVGLPPALTRPRTAPQQAAPPPTPAVVIKPPAPIPATATAAATAETAGGAAIPHGAAPATAAPWLAAIVLALLAGGLAVALLFALRQGNSGALLPPTQPPAPPPTESPTPEAPSATADQGAVFTATAEPTVEASPTTAPTEEPSATAEPTIQPTVPPTVRPPTATTAPSATPTEEPSATPTDEPSPTPVTPTAEASCDPELMTDGFGRVYEEDVEVRVGLGCPLAREEAGRGSEQFFENGTMFYWDQRNQAPKADYIYVFYDLDDGRYDELSPEDVAAYPEPERGEDPNQPIRGFGRVYFGHQGASEQLGEWTSPEIELKGQQLAVMQLFEQGMMIYTPRYEPTGKAAIFVLYNTREFERFDDTSGG
jgi:tRNA A-37 threonylcarbamoyl transferase component Bud32